MVYATFGIWSMIQHWTLALGLPKHDLDWPPLRPLFRDSILSDMELDIGLSLLLSKIMIKRIPASLTSFPKFYHELYDCMYQFSPWKYLIDNSRFFSLNILCSCSKSNMSF